MIDGRPHTHRCARTECDKAFGCKRADCQDALYKMCGECKQAWLADQSCSTPNLSVRDADSR